MLVGLLSLSLSLSVLTAYAWKLVKYYKKPIYIRDIYYNRAP
jgi:hypothetical protein